jgi:D-3-phosphoglycerate dehydrogenase
VCTPHLGASTEEAQEKVAVQIAHQVIDALRNQSIAGAVNADAIRFAMRKELQPFLFLAEKIGSLISQVKAGGLHSVTISVSSPMLDESLTAMGSAVLKGIFGQNMFEQVNYINALVLARERGIAVDFHRTSEHSTYTHVLTVAYRTERESKKFAGTVFGQDDARIVEVDNFHVELHPKGNLLMYVNIDRPGMLAAVSGILAKSNINIASLYLGRTGTDNQALTIVATDTPVTESALKEIGSIQGVSDVRRALLA